MQHPEIGKWRKRGYSYGKRNIEARHIDDWAIGHMRSFRVKLMKAVPLYQFVEYHYETKDYIAWPIFQDLSPDSVQIWANIQLAGN